MDVVVSPRENLRRDVDRCNVKDKSHVLVTLLGSEVWSHLGAHHLEIADHDDGYTVWVHRNHKRKSSYIPCEYTACGNIRYVHDGASCVVAVFICHHVASKANQVWLREMVSGLYPATRSDGVSPSVMLEPSLRKCHKGYAPATIKVPHWNVPVIPSCFFFKKNLPSLFYVRVNCFYSEMDTLRAICKEGGYLLSPCMSASDDGIIATVTNGIFEDRRLTCHNLPKSYNRDRGFSSKAPVFRRYERFESGDSVPLA